MAAAPALDLSTPSSAGARSSGAIAISPTASSAATGYYVSGDYQFGRRWFGGVRFDRSDRADNALLVDKGQSLMLTYWPSEFSQVRGQYRRTVYADGTGQRTSSCSSSSFRLVRTARTRSRIETET